MFNDNQNRIQNLCNLTNNIENWTDEADDEVPSCDSTENQLHIWSAPSSIYRQREPFQRADLNKITQHLNKRSTKISKLDILWISTENGFYVMHAFIAYVRVDSGRMALQ